MSNAIAEPAQHRHRCGHPCRCFAPKASECLKCAQARGRKHDAELYQTRSQP